MNAALDKYAVALSMAAAQIVAATHQGRDIRPAMRTALALRPPVLPKPHRVDPYVALLTMVAAQVDQAAPVADRLRWARAFNPEVVAAVRRAS